MESLDRTVARLRGTRVASATSAMATRVEQRIATEDLAAAERDFERWMCKRYSPDYAERLASELMSQARLEVAAKIERGEQVETVVGLLVRVAQRRLADHLRRTAREPVMAPLEAATQLQDGSIASPEEEALATERRERLREAVARAVDALSATDRRFVYLHFFEGLSAREAWRRLGVPANSHTVRWRQITATLQANGLKQFEPGSDLALDIGLAALAALGPVHEKPSLPRIENLLAPAREGVRWLSYRVGELVRKVQGAFDSSGMAMGGYGSKAAAACATAALACAASGVVGPGVGGLHLFGGTVGQQGGHGARAAREKPRVQRSPAPAPILATQAAEQRSHASSRRSRPAPNGSTPTSPKLATQLTQQEFRSNFDAGSAAPSPSGGSGGSSSGGSSGSRRAPGPSGEFGIERP